MLSVFDDGMNMLQRQRLILKFDENLQNISKIIQNNKYIRSHK